MVAVNTSSILDITIGSDGQSGNLNGYFGYNSTISGDGRFITFRSNSTKFVPSAGSDGINYGHVYLRDTLTGTTQLIDRASDGTIADSGGYYASVSDDGRYCVFTSDSHDIARLVNTSEYSDQLFLRDMMSGRTIRISQGQSGVEANADILDPTISGDGRYVLYWTNATNLDGVPAGGYKVVRYDTLLGTNELVSVNTSGQPANYGAIRGAMSQDGRYVVFESSSTDLTASDTGGTPTRSDIYIRDMVEGVTKRVSVNSANELAAGGGGAYAVVSGDGRFVAFTSSATNLGGTDNNNASDIFLRDTVLGKTTLISASTDGVHTANAASDSADISDDGRYVVWESTATDLANGPGLYGASGFKEIYLRDTVAGTTIRLSMGLGGKLENGDSYGAHISADGHYVTYTTSASNLIPGDSDPGPNRYGQDVVRVSLLASDAADYMIGSEGADTIAGLGGSDIINAGGGNDSLDGGAGNDTIYGGLGNDTMTGGAGGDTFSVETAGDVVIEAVGGGTDTVLTSSETYTLRAGSEVEVLRANGGIYSSFKLTGNEFANRLFGQSQSDTLNGGGGADMMVGYDGNDTYYVDNAGDAVTEAANFLGGTDSVYATASYALGANVENLYALAAGLTLTGNELGNSFLDFATGAGTTLAGGAGNDTYSIRNANSTVTEAAGTAGGGDAVYAYTSFNLATRGANVENILANAAGLTITGNDLNNGLYDFTASGSTMVGGAGSDTYFVRNGNSLITEAVGPAAGTDTVYAYASFDLSMRGANVEVLRSNTTAGIVLTGNDLGNTIMGGTGADTLVGKLGLDTLTGGAGADRFVFNTAASAANFDTLTDFSHADDTISLSKTSFAALTGAAGAGIDPSQFNAVLSSAAYEANDRIIYQTDTGKLFYDVDGYGASTQAAVQIALLSTKPQDVAANDFLLIA